jgi:hypothetical protein
MRHRYLGIHDQLKCLGKSAQTGYVLPLRNRGEIIGFLARSLDPPWEDPRVIGAPSSVIRLPHSSTSITFISMISSDGLIKWRASGNHNLYYGILALSISLSFEEGLDHPEEIRASWRSLPPSPHTNPWSNTPNWPLHKMSITPPPPSFMICIQGRNTTAEKSKEL